MPPRATAVTAHTPPMVPSKRALARPAETHGSEEDENDDCVDETRSVESSDAGSLVDFVVDDDDDDDDDGGDDDGDDKDEEDGDKDGDGDVEGATEPSPVANELDGIDPRNIVEGKRARRRTVTYEEKVFASDEYRRMMLDDVPSDEMTALASDNDTADDDDEEDENYSENEARGEEESDSEDEDEDEDEDEEADANVTKEAEADAIAPIKARPNTTTVRRTAPSFGPPA